VVEVIKAQQVEEQEIQLLLVKAVSTEERLVEIYENCLKVQAEEQSGRFKIFPTSLELKK